MWAWGMENIDTGVYKCGRGVYSFLGTVMGLKETTYYFHNLKFDGGFILDALLKSGFKYVDSRTLESGQFTTLITDRGQFYSITAKWGKRQKTFKDSLKIIPNKIENFPKMFGLETTKGEIDYNKEREVGYNPSPEEWDYLQRDAHILACGLKYLFDKGLTRMTAASNAYGDLKEVVGESWDKLFPQLEPEIDGMIRQAYKGGYCIVGPAAVGDVGAGIVLDKNSMYPWAMSSCLLPYGEPVSYTGEYIEDKRFPLYVHCLRCSFHVKQGHLPTIQLKHTFGYQPTEYVRESAKGEIVELVLTNVDLKLFEEHYEIYNREDLGGWKFQGSTELLKRYVEKWYKVKEESTINGNKGMRTLAKLMLNSAYGKFGKRGVAAKKEPYLKDDMVKYKPTEMEECKLEYCPMAAFITAYARDNVIRLGQKYYDRLLYIDTDSLHLLGTDIPNDLDIDPSRLGAWDLEMEFVRARYLRPKTYLEDTGDKLVVKCAGLPERCKEGVTWENFKPGAVYHGKLQHKTVPGGVILAPTDFKIKFS